MKKSRFTEAQIIGVPREQEAGGRTDKVSCRHGISLQAFYRWKAKYGGLEVSDANRVFKGRGDIVAHCCAAWNNLTDQPWRIRSIGERDWAQEF